MVVSCLVRLVRRAAWAVAFVAMLLGAVLLLPAVLFMDWLCGEDD